MKKNKNEYGKEDFDLNRLKRDDLLITFDRKTYVYTTDNVVINIKTLDQKKIGNIALDIKEVKRKGLVIANRNRYYKNLKRSKQYDRLS